MIIERHGGRLSELSGNGDSIMLQRSNLGPLLFLLYTSDIFSVLENKLIDNADKLLPL